MRAFAVLLAAGKSERFTRDKLEIALGDRPVWRRSYDLLADHPEVEAVGVVGRRRGDVGATFWVEGGQSRTESAAIGLANAPDWADVVLFHDAARPFASAALVTRLLEAVERSGAAYPGLPVVDTVRYAASGEAVDREGLVRAQTPQAARRELWERAYAEKAAPAADDIELLLRAGIRAECIEGEAGNFKLTRPEDLHRAMAAYGTVETRVGIGYDVHAFSKSGTRPLMLGGALLPGERGLDGHSDADVVLHAIVDAILGAAAQGDIGVHFPPDDPRWKNANSAHFLEHALKLAASQGWNLVSVDATVIAERPRLTHHREKIQQSLSRLLDIAQGAVSIKATTHEGLGALGRGEGIACMAVATLSRAV